MINPESDDELRRLVEFEEALMSVTALDRPPPFRYDGADPFVARAYEGVTLLRRCADRATLFETDGALLDRPARVDLPGGVLHASCRRVWALRGVQRGIDLPVHSADRRPCMSSSRASLTLHVPA